MLMVACHLSSECNSVSGMELNSFRIPCVCNIGGCCVAVNSACVCGCFSPSSLSHFLVL